MTVGFLEDFVGSLGPHERVGPPVPSRDERSYRAGEFAEIAEGAAVDGLAFDDAEPDFDEVEPGR